MQYLRLVYNYLIFKYYFSLVFVVNLVGVK